MPPLGVTPFELRQDLWHQKTKSMGYRVALSATFTQYWRVTDRQMDRQTNKQ